MVKFIFALICIHSFTAFAADAPDRSGTYQCKCEGGFCEPDYSFSYDQKTQFVTGEGPAWKVSGYVMRQEAKKTGAVYLTVPSAATFSADTITFSEDGKVTARGGQFSCVRQN